jgi:hypothetical protein
MAILMIKLGIPSKKKFLFNCTTAMAKHKSLNLPRKTKLMLSLLVFPGMKCSIISCFRQLIFYCSQTHSGLNMYKKANDRKSSLVVPLLSFVDFYRPNYVFIENVPGFLYFNLLARQKDKHTLEGGIKQGGVKLLIRALVDME